MENCNNSVIVIIILIHSFLGSNVLVEAVDVAVVHEEDGVEGLGDSKDTARTITSRVPNAGLAATYII